MKQGGTLVHGRMEIPDKNQSILNHAWVQYGDFIIDPANDISARKWSMEESGIHYIPESIYTDEEAMIMLARTGNYGKWYESEVIDILGRGIVNDPSLL